MALKNILFFVNLKDCFIQKLCRLNRQKPSLSFQKGQGIVEYLLILVVTVALVMALSRGVGKPLQNYIKQNVIEVVSCMLKVGQFPTKAFGLCQAAAQARFDFNGNIPNTSSSSSSSAQTTNNSSDSNNSGQNSSNNNNSSNNSSKPRFRSSNSSGSIDEGGSDSSDSSDISIVKIQSDDSGNGELSLKGFPTTGGQTVIIRKIRGNRISSGFSLSEDELKNTSKENFQKQTKRPVPVALRQERINESSFSIPKEKKRRPQSSEIKTELEFSFFGIIKWGIIFAILAVFGFFTMSQLNSIRKGWTD